MMHNLFNEEVINRQLKRALRAHGLDDVEKRIDSVNVDKLETQDEIYKAYAQLLDEYLNLEKKEKDLHFADSLPHPLVSEASKPNLDIVWQRLGAQIDNLKVKIFSTHGVAPLLHLIEEKASESTRNMIVELLRVKAKELADAGRIKDADYQVMGQIFEDKKNLGALITIPKALLQMIYDALENKKTKQKIKVQQAMPDYGSFSL